MLVSLVNDGNFRSERSEKGKNIQISHSTGGIANSALEENMVRVVRLFQRTLQFNLRSILAHYHVFQGSKMAVGVFVESMIALSKLQFRQSAPPAKWDFVRIRFMLRSLPQMNPVFNVFCPAHNRKTLSRTSIASKEENLTEVNRGAND